MTALRRTPGQTIGPFFGYALPFPGDHELVPPADPRAIRLHGTVFDGCGDPITDALLEIRQAGPDGEIPVAEGSLRRGGAFTGWGRAAVDPGGNYSFTTQLPGPTSPGAAVFFAFVVYARGLLDGLFTRAYVPGDDVALTEDRLLSGLDGSARSSLLARLEDNGDLRFDIHLQGPFETTFLRYLPGADAHAG